MPPRKSTEYINLQRSCFIGSLQAIEIGKGVFNNNNKNNNDNNNNEQKCLVLVWVFLHI